MYRVMLVPDRQTVVVHPVPDNHPRSKRFLSHSYCGKPVIYRYFYRLYTDLTTAESTARRLLEEQNKDDERRYRYGMLPRWAEFKKGSYSIWNRKQGDGIDACTGRRLLDRKGVDQTC